MARIHVVMSEEVLQAIELDQAALMKAIEETAGILKDEDYPHWRDTETVKDWVRKIRRGEPVPPWDEPPADEPITYVRLSGETVLQKIGALIFIALVACTSEAPEPPPPSPSASTPSPTSLTSGWSTWVDPDGAWEITLPPGYHVEPVRLPRSWNSCCTVRGEWLSRGPGPIPTELTMSQRATEFAARLPVDAALLQISQFFGPAVFLPQGLDNAFPISLEGLKSSEGEHGGTLFSGSILANGDRYDVRAFLGSESSADDRVILSEVLASWRFLPLETGTIVKRSRFTWFVVGPAERFPVGSVTGFDERNLPASDWQLSFYLVHVAEGFYALSWPDDLGGGYKFNCGVTFDDRDREFFCRNGAQWALDGSVRAKPDPGDPDDPLSVPVVRVSLDGKVIVTPNMSVNVSIDLDGTAP